MIEKIKKLIESQVKGSQVEVHSLSNSPDHLGIIVISELFVGKSLLEQHQIVMDILRPHLQNDLHAVQLTTKTP